MTVVVIKQDQRRIEGWYRIGYKAENDNRIWSNKIVYNQVRGKRDTMKWRSRWPKGSGNSWDEMLCGYNNNGDQLNRYGTKWDTGTGIHANGDKGLIK